MYRLDLADARLTLPAAVYRAGDEAGATLRVGKGAAATNSGIAFFAMDREATGTQPVFVEYDDERAKLTLSPANKTAEPLFHALPAMLDGPPSGTVQLYELVHADGRRHYTTDATWTAPGFTRSDRPLCRVWPSPIANVVAWK
jgi:hypothetical protein